MAVTSPWSRLVVEFLSDAGVPIHVMDVNNTLREPAVRASTAGTIRRLEERVEGVHAATLPRLLPVRLLVGAWALRRLVRRTDAQLVLTLYGGMQAAVAWLSGAAPYAVYVVGSDVLLANRSRDVLSRRSLRGASLVLANGGHLAERTRRLAPGVRVDLLYFGIDRTRFFPPARRQDAPTFVCSRAFAEVYDNATIVRAVAGLPAVADAFRLSFLSTGPQLAETVRLADATLEAGVRSRVHFAGGVSDAALVEALQGARFYLSASLSDGASVSLLEAMACGVLPIVSDIPANREWITHGENGLLFPPGDHVTLTHHMQAAMAGLPWHGAAVEQNLRRVAEHGDITANLKRLPALLQSVSR